LTFVSTSVDGSYAEEYPEEYATPNNNGDIYNPTRSMASGSGLGAIHPTGSIETFSDDTHGHSGAPKKKKVRATIFPDDMLSMYRPSLIFIDLCSDQKAASRGTTVRVRDVRSHRQPGMEEGSFPSPIDLRAKSHVMLRHNFIGSYFRRAHLALRRE